jgi:hypothetical protein
MEDGQEAYGNHPHFEIEIEVHKSRDDEDFGDAVLVRLILDKQTRKTLDQGSCNIIRNILFLALV